MSAYLHGYSRTEFERLQHQANFLADSVYGNLSIPQAGRLIEMGCGVGAQTRILLDRYPDLHITAIDRTPEQIEFAREIIPNSYNERVDFVCADLTDYFSNSPADAAFCCWMLEHVADPLTILKQIRKSLRPSASIHVTEVQNNSLQVYPKCEALENYWNAYNRMQMDMQGDPFVGVKLRSNLHLAGFTEISVRSQLMLFDQSDVNALDETCNYWWRLMDSAGNELEEKGYINAETRRSTRMHLLGLKNHENAVFSYTFIQAEARN
jgi:ubiquinone/menaquinone biosynthesis C-methylase UbiE